MASATRSPGARFSFSLSPEERRETRCAISPYVRTGVFPSARAGRSGIQRALLSRRWTRFTSMPAEMLISHQLEHAHHVGLVGRLAVELAVGGEHVDVHALVLGKMRPGVERDGVRRFDEAHALVV